MSILVCDDDDERAEHWRAAIEPQVQDELWTVDVLSAPEFREELGVLGERRRQAREGTPATLIQSRLDRAIAVVVDYDLPDFDDNVSGEIVAYLTRCYSTCGPVIGLNRFGDTTFDLTLKGHPESFPDLNLGGRQLTNPGLWREPFRGFRPWSWPTLISYCDSFEKRVEHCLPALDDPILVTLGLSAVQISTMSREAKEFLGGADPTRVTWREFVTESGQGLRPKDEPLGDEYVSRIAAARISKWLERLVLAGQDILVDAPHLASRLPGLIKGDRGDIATWNALCTLEATDGDAVDLERIAEHAFTAEPWLSRDAWDWQELTSSVVETDGWPDPHTPGWVFCEDVSLFVPREATREFVAEVPGPFVRRFVVDWDSHEGQALLADMVKDQRLHEGADPTRVEYRPAVRFAL